MNASLHCILLLACVVTCISSATIKRCKCPDSGIQRVDKNLILTVKNYPPRPYCKNQEVIVRLKDRTITCLDPTSAFTKSVLKALEKQKESQANKRRDSAVKSTTETAMGSSTMV